MTAVSFTLCAVDVTNPLPDGGVGQSPHSALDVRPESASPTSPDAIVWWSCSECGTDAELSAADGFLPSCPDCSGSLHELWRWEPVAA
jgi:hypothetical protein